MRIAIVHSFYSSRQPSGENGVVEAEVAALRRAGHEVALVAARTDDLEREPLYAVRSAVRIATGVGRSPLAGIRRIRPDVVHVHNLFPNFGRRWAASVDVPLVATVHNFRPLCANGLLFRDGEVCTLCADGRRLAGVHHACYRDSRLASLPQTIANLRGPAGDPLLRAAARVIVPSSLAADVFTQYGVDPARTLVWPHFVPADLDVATAPPERSTDGWIYVGRLSPEKGIAELVASWPPDQLLRVIGDGPDREAVSSAARGKRVAIMGKLPRSDVVGLMERSMGLVFPSRWWETFGLVYAEALSRGLPALAWEPSVVARAVASEGTGLVVRWSDDLRSVLTRAAEALPSLRDHCRAVFEGRYSEAAYVARATALYEELTGAGGAMG